MKKGIVDRIEGNIAVVEIDGEFVNMPLGDVPVSEGDHVETENGFIIKAYKENEEAVADLLKKLFNK